MPRTHLLPLHLMDSRAQPSSSSYGVSNAALEKAGLAHTNTGSSDSQEAIHIALYRDDNPPAVDCGYVTMPRFHWGSGPWTQRGASESKFPQRLSACLTETSLISSHPPHRPPRRRLEMGIHVSDSGLQCAVFVTPLLVFSS
jgi:hypothetical protein